LIDKLEKLSKDKIHSMIIQALALVKKNMFQDKEEADNLKKKKKKLMKLID